MGFTLNAKESAGTSTELLRASLADVQQISSPYDYPNTFFSESNGFLLVLAGDVSSSEPWLTTEGVWNTNYDGRGLHMLALPFNFTY